MQIRMPLLHGVHRFNRRAHRSYGKAKFARR